jgi:CBS domain containing-hemolysin-like protein
MIPWNGGLTKMENFFYLALALGLVLLNAFFVAAEFAMVKLRQTRVASIRRTHGLRGKILAQVHQHLDAYLSACQLGITLASLGLGWVGEPALAHLFEPFFDFIGLTSPDVIAFTAFFIAFSILSFLHIVVGELMPKSLAIRQSERVSLWTAVPLYGFYWLMYPAIWILNTCSNFLLRITKLDATHKKDSFYTPEELKLILSTTHLHGQLTKQEVEILKHTVDFAELSVTDVMRPREEMIVLELEQPIQETLEIIHQHRYSRYPIYSKVKKEIIGIVHVKDLFAASFEKKEINDLKTIMRPILKVSRRLPALKLLNKFRKGMPHFALVYSSKESPPLGFVTLDNLFQVLVGRIRDEFHKTKEDWKMADDGAFLMSGNNSIYAIERALDIDIDLDEQTEEEIDTITGLILNRLERLPEVDEKIEFSQFTIVVKEMKGPRIIQVGVYAKS